MQAVAWRQGSHAAACARLHLPQLLTASLLCLAHAHEAPASATPTQHLARARAAAVAMARGSLPSSGGEASSQQQQHQQQELEQCLEQWGGVESGPDWAYLPCSQQLQRLEVVLGAAMVAACEATLNANAPMDPDAGVGGWVEEPQRAEQRIGWSCSRPEKQVCFGWFCLERAGLVPSVAGCCSRVLLIGLKVTDVGWMVEAKDAVTQAPQNLLRT
eukprot:scaffold234348_cov21-Tisochrysis_lutea.AAC.1